MAFAIVRIVNLTVSSMQVVFNDDVDTSVGINNVSITSALASIENPEIISLSVENDIVTLTYRPLFPNVQYQLTFFSTNTANFKTVNGEIITEDGNRNSRFITSPGEAVNDIRVNMLESLPPIYETEEDTLVRKLISGMADQFQKTSDAIQTIQSANYLSIPVVDERMVRGDGPTDKLTSGGAFEVTRVGASTTSATAYGDIEFNSNRINDFLVRNNMFINPIISILTDDPISLQATEIINEKVTDDSDLNNHFNGLTIKVANKPVIQVISVSLKRGDEYIEYDIEQFGYILKSNRYDSRLCGINVNLEDNEVELSTSSITGLTGGFVIPQAGDEIYISYVYKRAGKNIDPASVSLTSVKQAVREAAPSIITRFFTKHAPIVTDADIVATSGGITFLSTQNTQSLRAFSSIHPAFVKEIKYSLTRYPVKPGEYSINYETGEVNVFGVDATNDGTGSNAPAMNYSYREIFIKDLDFSIDSDKSELSINSSRNIYGIEAKISFNYEEIFAEGVDYKTLSHVESLNERVNNNLIGEFKLRTTYYPVTDVFRIFNETTGEIYNIVRFDDSTITFSGRHAPRQYDVGRERVYFTRVPQEILLISEELSNIGGLRIFKINLGHNSIIDSQGRFIGANFDTSILFSNNDVFVREFFYEDQLFVNVSTNLNRLQRVGDYIIDYTNGIVYVAVSSTQNSSIGDISYQYRSVQPKHSHLIDVYDVFRSASALNPNVSIYSVTNITDTTAEVLGLERVGQRFISNNTTRKLTVGLLQSGDDGLTVSADNIFTSNSAVFTSYDIGRKLVVGSNNQLPIQEFIITGIINTHQVIVDDGFITTKKGRVWSVFNTYRNGTDGITADGYDNVFTSNSAVFTSYDVGKTLIVGSSTQPPIEEFTIIDIISTNQIRVNSIFSSEETGRIWSITDMRNGSPKTIALDYDALSVRNIYSEQQLASAPTEELDGYFDINRDIVDGNLITLGLNNPLNIGDSVLVNYNYGELYIDYRYLRDELLVSYEYGNNCLDWSISDALLPGQEYFVTYKYGALRESLLSNFGALTQIKELTAFSTNFDREKYRSIVGGTLQSFITGPTIGSIERLVESFTNVTPVIKESAFNNWVLGRDYLHLRDVEYNSTPVYDIGKYKNGLVVSDGQVVRVPAISHVRLNEGTIETWLRPQWRGLENDATITFDLLIDGYVNTDKIYIGFDGAHPASVPFSLNTSDTEIIVTSSPINIDRDTGIFIWYDEYARTWQIRWRESKDEIHTFKGTITTTGEFFNIAYPTGEDGYSINESSDLITSTVKSISFDAVVDYLDDLSTSDDYAIDGFSFASGDIHYIFDIANKPDSNRISLFKDGTGFLNFQVFDNRKDFGYDAGFYNLSTDIRDWEAGQLYHVATSWKFNSVDEKDEMHLFVNGQEVPNLFKYGGNPKANSLYQFGNIAEEIIASGVSKPTIGGFDGILTASSNLFRCINEDFEAAGVRIGDVLNILDDVPDGTGDPNFGASYTIIGVGTTTLLLDRPMTTSMDFVHFSVNMIIATVDTPVNYQNFMVMNRDAYGQETELYGLDTSAPDYSIYRGSDYTHIINITNGISIGSSAIIKPLGLFFRKTKEKVYVYGGGFDEIRLRSSAPITLQDVKITPVIVDKTLIETGGGFGIVGTIIGAQLVTLLQARFDEVCQPSNSTRGRKLSVYLSGDNINYDIPGNQIIIEGQTYSGATSEVILFTNNDTIVTNEYWTSISSIIVSVIPIDALLPIGVLEIKENKSITESENYGDKAEVVDYDNGLIRLETYGSGGQPYVLNACTYEIEYPTFLKINIDKVPDTFTIGSDFNNDGGLKSTIDEFRILDYMSDDTRTIEKPATGTRTITTDYYQKSEYDVDNNTLLLLHFNNETDDSSTYVDRFGAGYEIAPSLNTTFGNGIKFAGGKPYTINNAGSIFINKEGTIEFWVGPLDDSLNDTEYHYYVDMAAIMEKTIESSTNTTVILPQKARAIDGVFLATDIYKVGTNYFNGGSLSNVDSKTITLGIPLPAQNVDVVIVYTPLDSVGDRVSIFRDPAGFINFFVKASNVEHIISAYMDWDRHTWHRIMVMWKTNSVDNKDRLRLFVDGNERGTIKYGTGLIYGTGVIYGQAEVRPGQNRFIVDNIDLTDTFATIFIGADVFGLNGARAVLDNIRFSDKQRLEAIKTVLNDTIDINYTTNPEFAIPVIEDLYTTAIYDFDQEENAIEYLATVVNESRGIFRFEVEVIDSFDKVIGNTDLENLLVELINTIKPAHTEAIITFVK